MNRQTFSQHMLRLSKLRRQQYPLRSAQLSITLTDRLDETFCKVEWKILNPHLYVT